MEVEKAVVVAEAVVVVDGVVVVVVVVTAAAVGEAEVEGEVEGCLATMGPFLVTPSPPPFLSLSLKEVASILLCLPPSPLLVVAGEAPSPCPPRPPSPPSRPPLPW